MKRLRWIWILVGAAILAACTSRTEQVPELAVAERSRSSEGPSGLVATSSPVLSSIDSLMWQRPDSALMCLLPYFDTACGRDAVHTVSTASDWHYANLLLAELLYKNDNPQLNRTDLLQAVDYYDSLCCCRDAARHVSTDPTLVFLDARAHYINGVGYYEHDSVVEACQEYLKALEVMEGRFEEKELKGKKAKFMVYNYNRLGDLFEDQMLTEPAIVCYKNALAFNRIEPTSQYGVSTLLYNIGIMFDIAETKDSAILYYDRALAAMPDIDNIHYRDIMTTKAVNAYYSGNDQDTIIDVLKHILSQSADENERLTRLLTLGNILFHNKQYDSSKVYLETVFEQQEDVLSKIQAAENLYCIYQIEADSVKTRQYSSFLASFTVKEIEQKTIVSEINELFRGFLTQKQGKLSEEAHRKNIIKVICIIVIIAITMAMVFIILIKRSDKKLLKKQQEEAIKTMEKAEMQHELALQQQHNEAEILLEKKDIQLEREKKARQREKEKLQQVILQQEARVNTLKTTLDLQQKTAELHRISFMREPICCKINDSVRGLHLTARNSHKKYVIFTEADAVELKAAVLRHYENFETVLFGKYPKLSGDDLQLCQLYLIGLNERQIAVLQNKTYSAIKKRASLLKELLGLNETLATYILKFSSFEES